MSMAITRLRVEQLRQFRQPLELSGFDAGLNIFSGPNEAGKSTLVRAIRAAFFERHRSTAVDDLRPWGDGAAAPGIELDFRLGGESWSLSKSFLARKRCTLRIGSRLLEGVEAEDHLGELFGFGFAGKGASRPEHWGIPGLLWVDQGHGHELDVSHARDHLHSALQGPGGQPIAAALAATGGDDLLEQLRAQRNELLTLAGKPRGSFKEVIDQAEALAGQLGALDAQIATYRQQVDQLAALRTQQQADDAERPWEGLGRALDEARARQQALQQQQQQLEGDRARHAHLLRHAELLAEQMAGHARLQDDATRRRQALASAAEQAKAAQAGVAGTRQRSDAAQAHSAVAREALRLARQESLRADLLRQLADSQASSTRLQADLQRAEAEQQRLAALQQQAGASAIQKAEVDGLRRLERTLRELQLQRDAVATRLDFALDAGQVIELQREPGGPAESLSGEGTQRLTASATLHIPGLGRLPITPGGQDVGDLTRRHAAAQDALQAALQRAGLADLATAEQRLATHSEQLGQIRLAEQALALTAPHGLDALRAAAAEGQARIRAAQEALSKLPAPPAGPVLAQPQAEAEQDSAQALEDSAARALQTAHQQQAACESRLADARRELASTEAMLADPARQQRLADAQQQLLAATAERDALAGRIGQTQAQLLQARPDIVAQDIQRLQRSVEQLGASLQQRREQILRLETALEQAGAQGLEEERAARAGEHERALARQAELQRRAAALDLLCRRLDAHRDAALARLQAPLQQRLQHYLQLLFPSASLQIDAQLAPGTLTRQGAGGAVESGDVSALSFGAREQLGLIARFAYADLLREAGRPTLLILDDALVHSDDQRLAQMKRVLFDAAQRHQVLLFTCHPGHWRDMGVPVRALTG